MYLKMYKKYGAVLSSLFLAAQSINAQTDSLFLTIDQLFERGVQHSLQLQADVMKESMAAGADTDRTVCTVTGTADRTERGICRAACCLGTGIIRSFISGSTGLVTKLCD